MILIYVLLGAVILAAAYRWQFWRLPKKGLLALMYHHIGTCEKSDEQFPFTIFPARFEQQILSLKKHGFTPIRLADLEKVRQGEKLAVKKPVLLTFDDGYSDSFTQLFPILQKHQVPAVIFLITDSIGQKEGYLTWEQVRQMKQSGLVEFGSHTCEHARLRSLPEDEILKQLIQSKQKLEKELGVPCLAFCYPFGSGGKDKRVRPLVFQAGYQYDFSTKPGINPYPWKAKKTILRAFPRGGETLTDFYIQITRGRSRF
ncbi:MAG: polysaccharide deacetylase family protein [Elusimicrobiaceae bacterium]|nr:polysaccharide deacetylase family protein [Elusimicrobiaceae bacterium]